MTTPLDAPDWRSMSHSERDLGLNNGVAVAGSAEIAAGWEQRSARNAQAAFRPISISATARASATGSIF